MNQWQQNELPFLHLTDGYLFPGLPSKYVIQIKSIEVTEKWLFNFPLLGVVNIPLNKLHPPQRIAYGILNQIKAIDKDIYQLEINGLGIAQMTRIYQKEKMNLCQAYELEYNQKILPQNSFRMKRLNHFCEHFINNNIPRPDDRIYWKSIIQTQQQKINFISMLYLNKDDQKHQVLSSDINDQLEYLIDRLPSLKLQTNSKIMSFSFSN